MRLAFLLLILLQTMALRAAEPAVRFERLTIEDGLSQSVGLAILRDKQGFMWFGTYDGLNRYDGYQFKHFRYDQADVGTLSNNTISALFEDTQGTLWVGTEGGGLNRFDRKNQRFTHFRHDKDDPDSLSHDVVTSIEEDVSGRLWVGTLGGGLNLYQPKQAQFKHFSHEASKPHSLSHDNVRVVFKDHKNSLWVGTDGGGLNRFDEATGQFTHFIHDPTQSNSLSHNSVYAIANDSEGNLWVGTFGGGLNRFEVKTQTFVAFKHQATDPSSLSNDYIWSISEGKPGILWIGTEDGLSEFDIKHSTLTRFFHQPSDPNSLSNNTIRSIYTDNKSVLWLGTFGGGINRVDSSNRQFGHFKHDVSQPGSLSNNHVFSFHLDAQNALYIATSGGLNKQSQLSDDFEHFNHQPGDTNSLGNNYVWSIHEDSSGILWVGTSAGPYGYDKATGQFKPFEHNGPDSGNLSQDTVTAIHKNSNGIMWFGTWGQGIVRFDTQTQEYKRYKYQSSNAFSLSNDIVLSLFEDSTGALWIGTNDGLNRWDEKNKQFVRYVHDKNNPDSISQGYVMSVFEDRWGTFWVGTSGGLNQWDPDNAGFSHYGEAQGLANDVIYCVTEDKQGKLWMSTNRGLSSFNPRTRAFKNYDVTAGLQSNEFNHNACMSSADGELFFGGVNGFNRFYPEQIKVDKALPPVVYTDFLLFNQKVSVQAKTQQNESDFSLPKAIDQLTDLTLGYKQSLFSFEFAALDYHSPMNNSYEYTLKGYDDNWIKTDAKIRRATYTNLPSGHYTLQVRASNRDGYWNQRGASINIHIKPPPWLTWWAFVLYISFIVLLIYGITHYWIERSRMRNELSVINRLKQLDKLKDAFLANTSHELRTPLNGIIGLADSLIDGVAGKLPETANKNLSMVVSSGKRLTRLVDDILDLSKLKHSGIVLNTQPLDLYSLTEVVLILSKPLLKGKQLKLVNAVPRSLPAVEADEDRLQQIFHNLIGNAIKFTDSGTVTVTGKISGNGLKISVTDTGIGISEDKFATIFESFGQVQADIEWGYGGTGLGLTITRQLIELHKGTIDIKSTLGEGSTFFFTLPASSGSKSVFLKGNIQLVTVADTNEYAFEEAADEADSVASQRVVINEVKPLDERDGFRLLLVDDEPINLQVMHNHLSMQNYQLVEAADGFEALRALEENGPFDLVLLDIMMPKMSGYDVCKTIRKRWSISELPVIFLTAKNQVEDLVCGFELGANDHLVKPVAKQELLSRVEIHLKMLDINRNLDRIVGERTAEIVSTQKKLVLSEKLATLGNLMASVAHEINNPTHYVQVSVQNLEVDLARCQKFIFDLADGDEADEEILDSFRSQFDPLYQHIGTIKEGAERIQSVVKDLKTSSYVSEADKAMVCITDLLISTINLISTKYRYEIEITTDFKSTPMMTCNPAKLNQVFMNLLVNACDALEGSKTGQIVVGCELLGDKVNITIKDNGCGMTEETKGKLFEPFYTTKDMGNGTGLGLSISYDIVSKHGGELTVESELGEGSVFLLVLPM